MWRRFLIRRANDAWDSYLIQNKNFQNIFDRQIQSMDFSNSMAQQEGLFGLGVGAIQGGISGAVAGGMIGGPWGAVAGAAVGLTAGVVGGAIDYDHLIKKQEEARDFRIDMYNMQLGNIKALPISISRTDALTANNKLFPFVEVYECTEEEKQAYLSKLEFDGMTIGKIDDLGNWYDLGYIKAQLIRCENISDDYHMLNEIGVELNKGVYM